MSEDLNIDAMNLDELKDVATTLEIKFAANIGEETLRNKIREVLGEAVEEPEISHASVKDDDERVTIIINESENDKQPVQVLVNGKSYVMKRGKPVSVPPCVIEVLKNATKVSWDSEMKEYTKVERYPFRTA